MMWYFTSDAGVQIKGYLIRVMITINKFINEKLLKRSYEIIIELNWNMNMKWHVCQ